MEYAIADIERDPSKVTFPQVSRIIHVAQEVNVLQQHNTADCLLLQDILHRGIDWRDYKHQDPTYEVPEIEEGEGQHRQESRHEPHAAGLRAEREQWLPATSPFTPVSP